MKIGRTPQALLLAGLFALAGAEPAFAAGGLPSGSPPVVTEQTIYKFCPQAGCADGSNPYRGSLFMDGVGNLYGTTSAGGANSAGTVFKLAPNDTGWTETVLYSFCPQGVDACFDGAFPYSSTLLMDGAGNLYGTTSGGGDHAAGTVFKLTPSGSGWTESVLYSFCSYSSCTDGSVPYAGLIMDGAGNLYGTASQGGNKNDGVVYRLAPNGTGWTQSVLYSFCSQINCADGATVYSGLILDQMGNLYGTTTYGGAHDRGTVYKIAPTITGWAESVLYSFCSQPNCSDGQYPYSALILDGAGNLYGTTLYSDYGGAAFQLSQNITGWTERVLQTFAMNCSLFSCTDGAAPTAGLIMDPAGALYGTTLGGGGNNSGTVFKLVPTSSGVTETVLYSFCAHAANCVDGANPYAGLIMDQAGNLYGTTYYGGNSNCGPSNNPNYCGTVFRLSGLGSTLSVSVNGNPGGRVTSSPAGIECGATCGASFSTGTQVTLTATPATGWGLLGWGSACSGIAPSCTVKLNGSTNVSANFTTLFGPVAAPMVRDPTDTTALPAPIIGPNP
jgi:uncharacterized repeat protein (TIGR03803 family)